jgi:hypothetical protein
MLTSNLARPEVTEDQNTRTTASALNSGRNQSGEPSQRLSAEHSPEVTVAPLKQQVEPLTIRNTDQKTELTNLKRRYGHLQKWKDEHTDCQQWKESHKDCALVNDELRRWGAGTANVL